MKFLLAKLAFFLYGFNPVGMQHDDDHHDTSLWKYPIPSNLRDRLRLLALSGFCSTLVQRLQGKQNHFSRSKLTRIGFCLFSKVYSYQEPRCAINVDYAHKIRIISIAIHPKEPLMLTGSFDGTTKLWYISSDGLTPYCIGIMHGRTGRYVAFSPEGPIFATSDDNAVILFEYSNVSQGGSILTRKTNLIGHTRLIIHIAFHPSNSRILATASVDGTVGLWFIHPNNIDARLRRLNHDDVVFCVDFHPRELLMATGCRDFSVRLWDICPNLSSVRCISKIEHSCWPSTVSFHPTARIIACGCTNETVYFWDFSSDLSNPTCLNILGGHDGTVNSVEFNPSAPILTTSDWGGNVRYFLISPDARHAKLVGQYLHTSSPVFCLKFHPTAEVLVIACEETVKFLE